MLVQSAKTTTRDPAFRAAVADVQRPWRGRRNVKHVKGRFAAGNAGQISKDGHGEKPLGDCN